MTWTDVAIDPDPGNRVAILATQRCSISDPFHMFAPAAKRN